MAPNSFSPIDDVPEAQRDLQNIQSKQPTRSRGWQRWVVWFLVGLLSAFAGLIVSWLTYQGTEGGTAISLPALPTLSGAPSAETADVASASDEGDRDTSLPDDISDEGSQPVDDALLGHRAYEEASEAELVGLNDDASILMRSTAAAKFETMADDAQAQGIYLVPLSGFRSVEDQNYLFFEVKEDRAQGATTRSEVSAPPGYSEHHTGYAIDIGDANFPDTNLQVRFEGTPAFEWLEANAPRYSFELSFPEGNDQNIQYEPWHWRFVGDPDSLETFYKDQPKVENQE